MRCAFCKVEGKGMIDCCQFCDRAIVGGKRRKASRFVCTRCDAMLTISCPFVPCEAPAEEIAFLEVVLGDELVTKIRSGKNRHIFDRAGKKIDLIDFR